MTHVCKRCGSKETPKLATKRVINTVGMFAFLLLAWVMFLGGIPILGIVFFVISMICLHRATNVKLRLVCQVCGGDLIPINSPKGRSFGDD